MLKYISLLEIILDVATSFMIQLGTIKAIEEDHEHILNVSEAYFARGEGYFAPCEPDLICHTLPWFSNQILESETVFIEFFLHFFLFKVDGYASTEQE